MFREPRNRAVETMPDGMWAQASEDISSGLMGVISKLPKDEANLNALVERNKQTEQAQEN